jgi:hypothetical protein
VDRIITIFWEGLNSYVFCDPTILAQFFFVGQELPQMFLFLLAINQLLQGKYFLKAIALFFLGICSLRGMMLCGGFFYNRNVLLLHYSTSI